MKQVNTIHVSPKEYLNCILPINTTIQRRMRNGRQKTAIKEEKEGENIPGGDTIIHKIEKKRKTLLTTPPSKPHCKQKRGCTGVAVRLNHLSPDNQRQGYFRWLIGSWRWGEGKRRKKRGERRTVMQVFTSVHLLLFWVGGYSSFLLGRKREGLGAETKGGRGAQGRCRM